MLTMSPLIRSNAKDMDLFTWHNKRFLRYHLLFENEVEALGEAVAALEVAVDPVEEVADQVTVVAVSDLNMVVETKDQALEKVQANGEDQKDCQAPRVCVRENLDSALSLDQFFDRLGVFE